MSVMQSRPMAQARRTSPARPHALACRAFCRPPTFRQRRPAFLTRLNATATVIALSRPVPTGTLNSVLRDPDLALPSVSTSIGLDAVGNVYVSGSETRAAPRLTDAFIIVFDPAFTSPSA